MIAGLYLASIPYIVSLFILTGLFNIVSRPVITLHIIALTFLFRNFYVYVGTNFTVWKILSIAFICLYAPAWLMKYSRGIKNKYESFFVLFVIFVMSATFLGNGLLYLEGTHLEKMQGGWGKNEGRILFQVLYFCITVSLIFIPPLFLKSKKDIFRILKIIALACAVLAVCGLAQYILVKVLGFSNPFPIQSSQDSAGHTGYILGSTFRVNSIAGEPKHMGVAMALGAILLILSKMNKLDLIPRPNFWIPLFLMNLIFTYSTTGYALFILSFLLVLKFKGVFRLQTMFLFIIVGASLLLLLASLSSTSYEVFMMQLSKVGFEVQDDAVRKYFVHEEPLRSILGVGLGNIHHYAVEYLPDNFPLFRDTPFKGNTGIMIMIGDYGLLGFTMLYCTALGLVKNNLNSLKSCAHASVKEYIVAAHFTLILAAVFIFRYEELFFLFLGIMLHINKSKAMWMPKKG